MAYKIDPIAKDMLFVVQKYGDILSKTLLRLDGKEVEIIVHEYERDRYYAQVLVNNETVLFVEV